MYNKLKSFKPGTGLTILTVGKRDYIAEGIHKDVVLEGDQQPEEWRLHVTAKDKDCTVVELVTNWTFTSLDGVIFTETLGELIGHRPIGR